MSRKPRYRFRIPKEQEPGLLALFKLNDETYDRLVDLVRETPLETDREKSISSLTARADFLPPPDARTIITTAFALHDLLTQLEVRASEFIEDLTGAIRQAANEELRAFGANEEWLAGRLAKLLSIEVLRCRSKALDLQFANTNTLFDARVITDIRPIFSEAADSPPPATLVTHSLRLRYLHNLDRKELFVSLDKADIDELIEVLQRAKIKAETLESLLREVQIPFIGQDD